MMIQIEKTCPECGPSARLVLRNRHSDGHPFLGCENWRGDEEGSCSYTEPLPLSLEKRLRGDQPLPGFE